MTKGQDYVGVAVVFFCHDGKGNFLMQKRSEDARDERGKWDIGAGGLETRDTVDKTLKKEIKEEYFANLLKAQFLGFRDVLRKHGKKNSHWIALDFKVLVDPKTVKNGEPHKFSEIRWCKKNNFPKFKDCHSQLRIFLKKYEKVLWR